MSLAIAGSGGTIRNAVQLAEIALTFASDLRMARNAAGTSASPPIADLALPCTQQTGLPKACRPVL